MVGSKIASGGGGTAPSVTLIAKSATAVATGANTDPTDLWTFPLAGGSLAAAGDTLHLAIAGSVAANANAKTIEVLLNGQVVATQTTSTPGAVWTMDLDIFYVTATTTEAFARRAFSASATGLRTATGSLDFTASQTVIVRGTNGVASANDIVFRAGSATVVK